MRRVCLLCAAAAFVVSLGAPMVAEVKSVKGELIDLQCYTQRGAKATGEAHAGCALTCAKKGSPMGVLAEDGVYTITGDLTKENNKQLLEYIAKKVEVKGEVAEKDGQKTIAASAIEAAK